MAGSDSTVSSRRQAQLEAVFKPSDATDQELSETMAYFIPASARTWRVFRSHVYEAFR